MAAFHSIIYGRFWVITEASEYDRDRIINVADGAQVLVLDSMTLPEDMLALGAHRLERRA